MDQFNIRPMIVEMANGKEVLSSTTLGYLSFELGGSLTSAYFRVLAIGVYDGILGMDWLGSRRVNIHCAQGNFSFLDDRNQEVLIQGRNGHKLTKAKRFLKGQNLGQ